MTDKNKITFYNLNKILTFASSDSISIAIVSNICSLLLALNKGAVSVLKEKSELLLVSCLNRYDLIFRKKFYALFEK